MEWFDDEFFDALEKAGLVHSKLMNKKVDENPEFKRVVEERDYWKRRCEVAEKECDRWKELFENKHTGNEKLLETVSLLVKYL